MKGDLSLSTLESPSYQTVVPDSLLDMIYLPSDKHPKTATLWLPIYLLQDILVFWFPKPGWTGQTVSERGALEAFCLCKRVNGWRPLDLMEMNRELWERPCKCTSTTLVSGGPFPVARWIITMFLPGVRVLMWGAFGPPQVLFMAMIYSLKEQTGARKKHLI